MIYQFPNPSFRVTIAALVVVIFTGCNSVSETTTLTDRDNRLTQTEEQERAGLLALDQGKFATAEEYLSRAVANDAERWAAWNGLGIIADVEGNYLKAQEYFRKGLEIFPDHPKMTANLGWSKLLAGDLMEAEHFLRAAAKEDPANIATLSNLAFCLALQGDYQQAMQIYTNLYNKFVAANNVGYAAMVRGDNTGAKRHLSEALELNPSYYKTAANNLLGLQ